MKMFLKKLFFAGLFAFSASCSGPAAKLTSLALPQKELRLSSTKPVSEVSFLFIIDTSGSMSNIRETFSENVEKFLDVAMFYPYYNYNFAVMTMAPALKASGFQPLFMASREAFSGCGLGSAAAGFVKATSLGEYIRYTARDLKSHDYEKLLCLLSTNILATNEGNSSSTEMYFEPVEYALDYEDPDFSSRFFSPDSFLTVLFISDAVGDGLIRARKGARAVRAANRMAEQFKSRIDAVKRKRESFKIYAVVPLEDLRDSCGEGAGAYPRHIYKLISLANGRLVSICEKGWGAKLRTISKDIRASFQHKVILLDDIPKTDTIEVFYNGRRMPKDAASGWSYNPETVSIYIGDRFFPARAGGAGEKRERGEFTVRYYPLNPGAAGDLSGFL